jgi:hypothetical protein
MCFSSSALSGPPRSHRHPYQGLDRGVSARPLCEGLW